MLMYCIKFHSVAFLHWLALGNPVSNNSAGVGRVRPTQCRRPDSSNHHVQFMTFLFMYIYNVTVDLNKIVLLCVHQLWLSVTVRFVPVQTSITVNLKQTCPFMRAMPSIQIIQYLSQERREDSSISSWSRWLEHHQPKWQVYLGQLSKL